jgi:hypothetical protein
VRRIEKLCGFDDHLYDMLVAMIFSGYLGVKGKEEDIHSTPLFFDEIVSIFKHDREQTKQ